jgi:hypothetical protein
VAQSAFWMMDDCCHEVDKGQYTVSEKDVVALSEALAKLDELPDDKPGITMDGPGRAQWALQQLEKA